MQLFTGQVWTLPRGDPIREGFDRQINKQHAQRGVYYHVGNRGPYDGEDGALHLDSGEHYD